MTSSSRSIQRALTSCGKGFSPVTTRSIRARRCRSTRRLSLQKTGWSSCEWHTPPSPRPSSVTRRTTCARTDSSTLGRTRGSQGDCAAPSRPRGQPGPRRRARMDGSTLGRTRGSRGDCAAPSRPRGQPRPRRRARMDPSAMDRNQGPYGAREIPSRPRGQPVLPRILRVYCGRSRTERRS